MIKLENGVNADNDDLNTYPRNNIYLEGIKLLT